MDKDLTEIIHQSEPMSVVWMLGFHLKTTFGKANKMATILDGLVTLLNLIYMYFNSLCI